MSRPRHQDTMAIAEAALEQITARSQPADPRSYALWYKFATGNSGLLCAAVNSRLARSGTLDAEDIDELHSAHISPTDASAKVSRLGARVADEIEQVKAMIEAAEGSASDYAANLIDVSRRLGTVLDRDGVRAIVERLVKATKAMETTNVKLQDQLQAMWEEIAQLRRDLEVVRTEGLTDALTSLGNRKFFDSALERSVAECHADNEPLSLLLADIDHFKQINDTFGHVVGDRVSIYELSAIHRHFCHSGGRG
jgi:diguanylate cyclase